MGVFSSKKTIVDTSVSRVVDENLIPNLLTKTSMDNIFRGMDFTEALQFNVMNSASFDFENMYRWAAKPGNYYYGLPNAKLRFTNEGDATVEEILKNEFGSDIKIEYIKFAPINNFHIGWQKLVEDYGYNHKTNVLEDLTGLYGDGVKVYLDKMVAIRNIDSTDGVDQSTMNTWEGSSQAGETPDRPAQSSLGQLQNLVIQEEYFISSTLDEAVEIHMVWEDPDTGDLNRSFDTIGLSQYVDDQEYFQAKYKYLEGTEYKYGYWTYDPVTGSYTQLNEIFGTPTNVDPGTYFPFVMFRAADTNRADPSLHDTDEYKSTVRLLNKVGMDYQFISDSIHENPDINDIDQAVMMLASPLTTDDVIQNEYLFKYFDDWHKKTFVDGDADVVNAHEGRTPIGSSDAVFVLENNYSIEFTDSDFWMQLSFQSISKTTKAGTLAEKYVGSTKDIVVEYKYTQKYTVYNDENDRETTEWREEVELIPVKARVLQRQISKNVYEELVIVNPQSIYAISGKGVFASVDDDRLMVPLDYEICKQINILKREHLYMKSLNLVFNARVVQKLKWYESNLFQGFMFIVAVVITAVSFGVDGGSSIAGVLGVSGANAVAILTLIEVLVVKFITAKIVALIFAEIVEILGIEAAFILAVALAAFGMYQGFKGGMGFQLTPLADNLLQVSTGLTQGVNAVVAGDMEDLADATKDFNEIAEAKSEELEEIQKLLDGNTTLDPFAFIGQQPFIVAGESPEGTFSRTIHSGNVGTVQYDFIKNYVDISLKLPTVNDTLGDTFYG